MRFAFATSTFLGLTVCLLAIDGCAGGRETAGTVTSPEPFIRELEDPNGYHLLLTGRPQTCGMRSGRVQLAPGMSIGLHNTRGNEELLIFLSGSGVARLGEGASLHVGVGKIAYIPPETAHDIVNTGSEPLAYVFCVAPINPGRRGSTRPSHHLQATPGGHP